MTDLASLFASGDTPQDSILTLAHNAFRARPTSEIKAGGYVAGLGPPYEQSGFVFQVPTGSMGQLSGVRAYAVMQDGTAQELNYAASIRAP